MGDHINLFPRNTNEYTVKDIYMLAGRNWVLPDDWSYPMLPSPEACPRSLNLMQREWDYRLHQREILIEKLTDLRGHIPTINSDKCDRRTPSSLYSALNMAREENNRIQIRINRYTLFNELRSGFTKRDILKYATSDPNCISDYEIESDKLETDVWQRNCKVQNEILMLHIHHKLVRRKFKHGADEHTNFTLSDEITVTRCKEIIKSLKDGLYDLYIRFYSVGYMTSWENVVKEDDTVEGCMQSIASLKEHVVFGRLLYSRRCMKTIVQRHFDDLSIKCKERHWHHLIYLVQDDSFLTY